MLGGDLRLEQESNSFRVSSVYKNSPVSEVRVNENDLMTTIDGQPVLSFSLDQVRRTFAQEKDYRLDIRRGSETKQVKIKFKKAALGTDRCGCRHRLRLDASGWIGSSGRGALRRSGWHLRGFRMRAAQLCQL